MRRDRLGLRLLVLGLGLAAVAVVFMTFLPMGARVGIFGLACLGILGVKRWQPTLFTPPAPRLTVDDWGVRRYSGDTVQEAVAWAELTQVSIMTTDEGPFSEDFYWLLYGAGHGCAVGQGLSMTVDLLGHLGKLPNFDHLAVIAASGSTDWQEFICWQGQPGDALILAGQERDAGVERPGEVGG